MLEQWVASGPQGSNQGGFNAYSAATRQAFDHTISWLKEWACSRSFGLGTKVRRTFARRLCSWYSC